MALFKPKFITFDCYGTLIRFDMAGAAQRCFSDRVDPDAMHAFTTDFSSYRLDEVLGAWKPYYDVVSNALQRTCKKWASAGTKPTATLSTPTAPAGVRIPTCPPGWQRWLRSFRWCC